MKKRVLAACVVLLFAASAHAVVIDYVENDSPGPGLSSYTLRATGVGIVCLSKFTIEGNVYQEFLNPTTQSPWLGDGSADPLNTGKDSYICFGVARLPDMAGFEGEYEDLPTYTTETIYDGSAAGLGTLNNDFEGKYDAYLYLGQPNPNEETRDLFNLVLEDGDSVRVSFLLLTVEDYDPSSGWAEILEHSITHNYFGVTAMVVPEPGTIAMLLAAGLFLLGCRLRYRR